MIAAVLVAAAGLGGAGLGLAVGGHLHRRGLRIDERRTIRHPAVLAVLVAVAGLAGLQASPGPTRILLWLMPAWVEAGYPSLIYGCLMVAVGTLGGVLAGMARKERHRMRWLLAVLVAAPLLVLTVNHVQDTRPAWPELDRRTPPPGGRVLQTSSYSCAAASVATVLAQAGHPVSESEAAAAMGTTRRGTSSGQIILGLRRLGFDGRRFAAGSGTPPAIIFLDHPDTGPESHAAAWLSSEGDRMTVFDPLSGESACPRDALDRRWRGRGVELLAAR